MKISYLLCFAFITAVLLVGNDSATASGGTPISFTAGIKPRSPAASPEIFYEASFSVDYQGGPVLLSGKSDGTGSTLVDDELIITVIGSDLVARSYVKDYSNNCRGGLYSAPPTDISSRFRFGINRVHVVLMDKCGLGPGAAESASSFWLLP